MLSMCELTNCSTLFSEECHVFHLATLVGLSALLILPHIIIEWVGQIYYIITFIKEADYYNR